MDEKKTRAEAQDVPLFKPVEPETLVTRESWRLFGIMAEFVEATDRLANVRPAVTVFGSARVPQESPYYQLAETIARKLSDTGLGVISGGGPGVMEAANRGAYEGKGPSVGLNIQLPHEQRRNPYQNVSVGFKHFFARKYMFVRFAMAYVVMPGGFGTLDELMEALTLIQTGKSAKFPVILVGSEFWAGLLNWLKDRLVAEKMIDAVDLDLIQVIDDPDQVVEAIYSHYETRGFAPLPNESELLLNL